MSAGAFQLELVVLVRDEGDFLQGIEGHAVQLHQHLGVALRGVDAFQAQERSGSACVKMPISVATPWL